MGSGQWGDRRRNCCVGAAVAAWLWGPALGGIERAEAQEEAAAEAPEGTSEDAEKKPEEEAEPRGSLAEGKDPADTEGFDEEGPEDSTSGVSKKKSGKKGKAAKAEEAPQPPPPPRDQVRVYADLVLAWGRTPAVNADSRIADATTFAPIVGGRYDLSPELSAGARLAWSVGDIQGQTQRQTQTAFGNAEVFGEYRYRVSTWVDVPIAVGIGIPIAQGDPDPASTDTTGVIQTNVNQTADGGRGWREAELYAVGRLPITPSVGISYRTQRLVAVGSTKLTIAPKIRGETTDADYGVRGIFMSSVTGGTLEYDVWNKLWLGLDAWLVWNVIEPIDTEQPLEEAGSFQLMIEPSLGYELGPLFLRASYIAPVGGPLGEISSVRLLGSYGL